MFFNNGWYKESLATWWKESIATCHKEKIANWRHTASRAQLLLYNI